MSELLFSFKEGIKGFKRAKLSSFVSIVAIFISLTALGIFSILTFKLGKILNEIENKVELEAFIDEKLKEDEISNLKNNIKKIEGVEDAIYISKNEAAKRFQDAFGENIVELYGDNPLPISFIIKIRKEFLNKNSMDNVISKLNNINGISETIFKREILLTLERYRNIFLIINLVGGILIGLASILIISNTIKLTIYAKSKTIKIMKLIGASDSFIKRPFLFEGLSQGFIGGILSSLFIYLLIKFLEFSIQIPSSLNSKFYGVIIISGGILGFLGSFWSVKKFLT
jgi:cell division transport system permease protein